MCQGCECANDCPNKTKMLDNCQKCGCLCHADTSCMCECAICECVDCKKTREEQNG